MKTATIIAAVTAGFAVVALCTGNWIVGVFPHPQTLLVFYLYWPMAIAASVVFIASLIRGCSQRGWFLPAALCLPMLGYFSYHPSYALNKAEASDYDHWTRWGILANRFNHLLREYYAIHPEQFRYVADDTEEVTISGFTEYVLAKEPNFPTTHANGQRWIRDPWGDPVCFVMRRGEDEYIRARGMREPISFGGGGELFDNPHGLGIARAGGPSKTPYAGYQDPIIVLMDYRWSRQYARDHPGEK